METPTFATFTRGHLFTEYGKHVFFKIYKILNLQLERILRRTLPLLKWVTVIFLQTPVQNATTLWRINGNQSVQL